MDSFAGNTQSRCKEFRPWHPQHQQEQEREVNTVKSTQRSKRLTYYQKVLSWQVALTVNLDIQTSHSGMDFAEKQNTVTCDTPAHCLPPNIQKSSTTQLRIASFVQDSQTRAANSAPIKSMSTETMQYCSQRLPIHMHHAHSCTELVWPAMYKSALHNSDHASMSWPLHHVDRMLLATPTVSNLGCLAASKTVVTDHLSKMHLHATVKCMSSYLLAFTLLTGQAEKLLLMTIWMSLAMFATALQTTRPGTDRRQTRTPWLAQTTQCIAHMLWLMLMILRHAASNVHSIAAICSAIMLITTRHVLIVGILIPHKLGHCANDTSDYACCATNDTDDDATQQASYKLYSS